MLIATATGTRRYHGRRRSARRASSHAARGGPRVGLQYRVVRQRQVGRDVVEGGAEAALRAVDRRDEPTEEALRHEDRAVLVDLPVHTRAQSVEVGHLEGHALVEGEAVVDDPGGADDPRDRAGVRATEDAQGVALQVVELVDVDAVPDRVHDLEQEALPPVAPRLGRDGALRVETPHDRADRVEQPPEPGRPSGGRDQRMVVRLEDVLDDADGHVLVRPLGTRLVHEGLEEVRERAVPDVVQQAGELEAEDVVVVHAVWVARAQVPTDGRRKVRDADRVLAPRVRRGGVDERTASELTDVVKAAEGRGRAHRPRQLREMHLAVDPVAHALRVHHEGRRAGRTEGTGRDGTVRNRHTKRATH